MTLDQLIDEVLALDEKATNGPWYQVGPFTDEESSKPGGVGAKLYAEPIDEDETGELIVNNFESRREEKDVALIAHYRTSAPELARQCRKLLEENRKLREALGNIVSECGIAPKPSLEWIHKQAASALDAALKECGGEWNELA